MNLDNLKKLVTYLVSESNYNISIPDDYETLKKLHRSLVNIREPKEIGENILNLEDNYLQSELKNSNIIDFNTLEFIDNQIKLFKGDITKLKCDIIVNAGNSLGLGCFIPGHSCIDNQIHTYAGIRLRLECNNILKGDKIKNGDFIVCDAYNLPSKKVITTVGPQIINNKVTIKDRIDLSLCYKNALIYAIKNNYKSICFPSISTGIFSFPIKEAKYIAYKSVRDVLDKYNTDIVVIFDLFSDGDYYEYYKLFKDKRNN